MFELGLQNRATKTFESCHTKELCKQSEPGPTSPTELFWLAVKEFKLKYHNSETILLTMYPYYYYGSLN